MDFYRDAGRRDRVVEHDLDPATASDPLALGHELAGPADGHRDDRRPALEGQKETAPAERTEVAVEASRPLGKDQERVALLPHERGRTGDALLSSLGPLPVDGDEADETHGLPDDGDPQDGLLEDDPGPAGDEQHHQGPVEEALVVGHEDVRHPGGQPVEARDADLDADDAPGRARGAQAVGHEQFPQPGDHAEEDERQTADDHEDEEEDDERGSHQSPPIIAQGYPIQNATR